METTKSKVLSVSKSVVRYQKYVHMKTCLARRYILYILEFNPHPNLICTSFCRFLKRKKLVHGSNPHLSFNCPLPTRQTDSIMSDDGESEE